MIGYNTEEQRRQQETSEKNTSQQKPTPKPAKKRNGKWWWIILTIIIIVIITCIILNSLGPKTHYRDYNENSVNEEQDDSDYDTSAVAIAEADTASLTENTYLLKVNGSSENLYRYFGKTGGNVYYSVSTTDYSYETWGVPSWCHIEDKTSSGFTLVCEENTSGSMRSDYMKIKSAGQEIRIDIEQAAGAVPTASITSVDQVHNVMSDNMKGMDIELKFDVEGMLDRKVKATALFFYGNNSTALMSPFGGQVSVSKSNTAPYENTTFTMTLFLPYQWLNMAPGWSGTLSFDIVIYDDSGSVLTRKNNNKFTYSNF